MSQQELVRAGDAHRRLLVKEGISPETFDLYDAKLFLDGVFQTPSPTRQQYRGALDLLGQDSVFSSIINSVLVDPALTQEVASRSFIHSTGMVRINLLATDKYQFRLHVWDDVAEDPHDHVYNFASIVKSGAVRTDLFMPSRSNKGLDVGEFTITSQKASSKPEVNYVRGTRLAVLSPPEGIVLQSGTPPYTMGNRVTHRVRNDPETVTLNLRGAPVKDTATFFMNEANYRSNLTTSPVDITKSLTRVLSIIGNKANGIKGKPTYI
jgi:hypothetical protein